MHTLSSINRADQGVQVSGHKYYQPLLDQELTPMSLLAQRCSMPPVIFPDFYRCTTETLLSRYGHNSYSQQELYRVVDVARHTEQTPHHQLIYYLLLSSIAQKIQKDVKVHQQTYCKNSFFSTVITLLNLPPIS